MMIAQLQMAGTSVYIWTKISNMKKKKICVNSSYLALYKLNLQASNRFILHCRIFMMINS